MNTLTLNNATLKGIVNEAPLSAKYAKGDVVEVYDGHFFSTTHRGTITNVNKGSSSWRYYIQFNDWYMINGWHVEADIQCKVN